MDISDLIRFYKTPLGKIVSEELSTFVKADNKINGHHLYVGFPFSFIQTSPRLEIYLMDRNIGAIRYPSTKCNKVALTDLNTIPLPDESMQQITIVHCLEFAANPKKFMRELWRVLTPEGTLKVIVPNRRSIWSHLDISPFGHGNPYSMSQLSTLAKECQFDIILKQRGLFILPHKSWQPSLITHVQQYLVKNITPKLSGVIIMNLTKRVYCRTLPNERKRLPTSESIIRAKASSFEDRG